MGTREVERIAALFGRDATRHERRGLLGGDLPERGNEQQPDSYGIYAPSSLVPHNSQWHLFHTGVNGAHNGKQSYGPPRGVIMHVTTRSI